ncbi:MULTISPECIES: aminoacyltransferase [Mammaliicoccus]|uniref:aminoacyltransferase n=1 Tax=Mammaliicoccus TaxID=2803850 RepID=UPI00065BE43F|nr:MULTISPECIES: aminoacyltransferase [Mammaliicoccus]MBO1217658.1 aminoacyltransferase [Mammaliicoccus sciuri]MBO1231258.1 aminoacyltransferase [Mammaliicoccus sciuri]PNY92573.1 aminoacyltransferase [Mammaliicoccus sciuri]PTJ79774.1 aminoacyltransferase [Mammaliicoccus sciuri]PTK02746.1 aminoacyltransferase [Mammaliicoccus sciuri]
MKFTNLTTGEFEAFTNKMPYAHFTQAVGNYELKTSEGTSTHLVGVKDNQGEVLAACLLTSVPVMKKFNYFYSNRGPVMDYDNKELVDFFFKEIVSYLKSYKGLFFRIDPYLPYQLRDHDGNIKKSFNRDGLIKQFESLGYEHQGFTTGFHPIHQIRWHSVLDLEGMDEKTLIKNMDSLRKRNTKKVQKNGVKVRFLSKDEMPIFRQFMEDTTEKKDFNDRGDDFYYNRLKYFENVKIPLAYIDFETYIPQLEKEHEQYNKDIAKAEKDLEKKPDNQKTINKIDNLKQQREANEAKLEEALQLQQEHGDTLPIAAGFFIINPFEVVYYAGGSSNEYRHFAGSYAIQWEMIKYALDHNIDRYNFYGISGDFSEDAPDVGVIKFKKGYNADVYEYIGDFVKPINKPAYKAYTTLKKVLKK